MLRTIALCLFALLFGAPVSAATLVPGDLVGVRYGVGLVRVDGTTGAQELITSQTFSDIAVAAGGNVIYGVRDGSLLAVDPATGAETPVASGFDALVGVAENGHGEVFVVDVVEGPVGQNGSPSPLPRLYRVDAGTGAVEFVLESALQGALDPSRPGYTEIDDFEWAGGDRFALLAEGAGFGAVGTSAGVVLFDAGAATEEILFSALSISQDGILHRSGSGVGEFSNVTGLGVRADGDVLATCDGDYDCGLWTYDFDAGAVRALGKADAVYAPDGTLLGDLAQVDVTETADGRMFVAPGSRRIDGGLDPGLIGILPVLPGTCSDCAAGSDYAAAPVAGLPFSAGGGWTEIQAVIPEPSTALCLAAALLSLAFARRPGGVR